MLRRVLIANRGEIALRVLRACRELGIETVAVYSQADADALHVQLAGQAVCIGPARAADSYLNQDALLTVAKATGCDGVHPGYGFLSENADFADACAAAGLTFIGPSGDAIRKAGSKSAARDLMRAAGVPVTPGSDGPVASVEEALAAAESVGYPVLLKASAGGGGRGIRRCDKPEDLSAAFAEAKAEAQACFGNDEMYLEKLVLRPRHIEFQVLADRYGNVIHLGDRDCSVQRRNQKLIEEAPAPFLDESVIRQLTQYSGNLFQAVDYVGLGTCEFMVTPQNKVYFLEVNPRLQVEHTVSEEVCGLDLVREQITIAEGGELTQAPEPRGHSFELRITCEDPATNLTPSSGTLTRIAWPSGAGIRIDSGVKEGDTVSPKFDSMMGKLIVTAQDRAAAVARVRRALGELVIEGVPTPASLFEQIFNDPDFTAENGHAFDISTKWLERTYLNREPGSLSAGQPASLSAGAAETPKTATESFVIEIDNRRVTLTVPQDIIDNLTGSARARGAKLPTQPLRGQGLHNVAAKATADEGQSGVIASPMQAVVTRINVAEGQQVSKGDLLVVLESMKMENYVYSPVAGTVTKIFVGPAAGVEAGETLVTLDINGATKPEQKEDEAK